MSDAEHAGRDGLVHPDEKNSCFHAKCSGNIHQILNGNFIQNAVVKKIFRDVIMQMMTSEKGIRLFLHIQGIWRIGFAGRSVRKLCPRSLSTHRQMERMPAYEEKLDTTHCTSAHSGDGDGPSARRCRRGDNPGDSGCAWRCHGSSGYTRCRAACRTPRGRGPGRGGTSC